MLLEVEDDITQEEIDLIVSEFSDIWAKQGAKLVDGWICPNDMELSVAIDKGKASKVKTFAFGIKFVAKSAKRTLEDEIKNFKRDIYGLMEETRRKQETVDNFQKEEKFDWSHKQYKDSNDNIHSVVAQSDTQVVTKCGGSFFVWHKASAEYVNTIIEEMKMVAPYENNIS